MDKWETVVELVRQHGLTCVVGMVESLAYIEAATIRGVGDPTNTAEKWEKLATLLGESRNG